MNSRVVSLDPLMAERIKAALETDNGAADRSVQSRAHNPSWVFFGYSPFVGVYRQRKESDVAPWGYANRDLHLRTFFHLAGNELVQSAESIMHQYVQSTDYTIEGPDRTANRVRDLLNTSDLGAGWETLLSKFLRDFDTTDNGVFIELIGEGDPDGPLEGWPIGIAHLDSVRCRRTGDLEYPVIYYDSFGIQHKLHATRVWYTADMPDTDERLLGYGQCALSRALSMAQTMISWSAMRNEWLDDKFPQGILVLNNINMKFWESRLQEHAAEQAAEEHTTFSQIMPLPSADPNSKAEVDLVPFRQIWEGFDQKVLFDLAVDMIAMGWGLDHQDLAPLSTSGMGSGAQSTVLDQKSRGKGRGRRLQLVERFINDITPPSVTFHFDQTDDAQDLQQANIRQAKSQTVISLYTAQKQQAAPADPMAAFLPTIQQTIGTDGLITRDEARSILVKEIPEWSEILNPPPPDDTDPDGPDVTLSGVLAQKQCNLYGPRVRLYKNGKRTVIEPAPQRTQRKQAGRALTLSVSDAEIAAARKRLAEMGIDLDREAQQTFGDTQKAARWEESKHPRADDGKFGHGADGSEKPKPAEGSGLTSEQQRLFSNLTPEQRARLLQSVGGSSPKPDTVQPKPEAKPAQTEKPKPAPKPETSAPPKQPEAKPQETSKPPTSDSEYFNYDRTSAESSRYSERISKQATAKLDKPTKKAVVGYSGSDYRPINEYLRGNKNDVPISDEQKKNIEHLDRAIGSSLLPDNTMLYRGFAGKGGTMLGKLKPGQTFSDNSFVSTTMDSSIAEKFSGASKGSQGASVMRIKAPKGTKGLPVSDISDFPGENEVLLPRGSKFKVVGKAKKNGITYVDVEAVAA